MTATATRALITVVLAPTNQPSAHSIECPASDFYIPARSGEPGDWSGDVADLGELSDRFPGVVLHPCLHKAARDYDIPAGLDGESMTARRTRAAVLVGHVLDTDAEPGAAVTQIRALLAVEEAYAKPARQLAAAQEADPASGILGAGLDELRAAMRSARLALLVRVENAIHALAAELELGTVDAYSVIADLRQRPALATW
ncbi:hypothetical protein [Planomonospora sp. ID82291]|uniref:hypothetical protein n=1 Tax=Planomonospora sp. ID82291 TaxID=2738136 RepID=UPI0018C3A94B|nr:hypothetical protein [Planomonospora sp. ID82291]MBG0818913.1 hypothetical protein [Planomonospora sp. ID82291]